MKLELAPPWQPGEPPTAYASRIAAAHGLEAKELCSDFGIRHLGLLSGRAPAISKLASLGGASETDLAHFAFARTSVHGFTHRGQMLRRENLIEGRLDVCPRCVVEDIERAVSGPSDTAFFCRAEWCLDVVDTCPTHQSALATIHRAHGLAYGMDFSSVLAAKTDRLREMAGQAKTRAPTGLQDYVLARLEGRDTGAPFLDAMELAAAIRTCEMLGAAACFGRKAQCDKLDASRLRAARIRGFEIGSHGKDGVEELLKSMTAAYSRRHFLDDGGFVRQAFATLHNYLHRSPQSARCWKHTAFDPLRTVIVDFIKANFPLKAGDKVLGEVIPERKLHSVSSLAKEIGFGCPRVTKLLQLHGVISSDQAGRASYNIVFDAAKGAEAVRESVTALPYRKAADYLGTGRHQVYMLAEANFIQPIESGPLGLRATFAPAMLDAFVARLIEGAQPVARKAANHITIAQAALRATCTQAEVAQLILDGKLKWVGTLGRKRDYQSILVDLAEVQRAAHALDPETISQREFAKRCGYKKEVAQGLVRHGHIRVVTCERAGHQVSRIPLSEVEAFRRRYISLSELSRVRRQHYRTLKKALDEKGIQPAFDPKKVLFHFYRWDEITAVKR